MAKKNIQSATKPTIETKTAPAFKDSSELIFKYLFFAVCAFVLFVRPFLSTAYGPSSDEVYHKPLGDLSYDYLASFGKNDSVFRYTGNGREDATLLLNYGPLLEVTAAAVYKNFGTSPFPTRHVVITIFCSLLFIFGGLAGKKIGGWRAGFLAMTFLLVSPRIFGEAFNNPKDPTFAAGYMMGLYGIILVISELPKVSWKSIIILMLGIGAAFAVRVGGLLLFIYTGMFVLLFLWLNETTRKDLQALNIKAFKDLIIKIAVAFVGAWIIGIITWPAAIVSPIGQPFHALAVQSSYPTVIRVLFGGEYIPSNEVPWNYNFTYILLTSPVIVILGIIIGCILLPKIKQNFDWRAIAILLFASLFPLFYIVYKKSPLLNGWRHSYFTYCGLAVFAAIAFELLFRMMKSKTAHIALYTLLLIGVLLPTVFIAKSFPVSYVYFNEIAGGVDEAYGNYQIDYYAASAKPAADWMRKNIPFKEGEKVVSNNPWELNMSWESEKSKRQSQYIRFRERNEQDWDYAVFLPQFVDPVMMRKHFFPPKGSVYEVKVDNSVIACVVKRENKSDFYGIEAVKKNDFVNAIKYLEDAVKYDPYNEIAWAYLGIAYANTGHIPEASTALTNSLNISPEYQLAQYYYQQISGGGAR